MYTFGKILLIIGCLLTLRGGYIIYKEGEFLRHPHYPYGVYSEPVRQRVTLHLAFGVPLLVTGIFLILRENE